MMKWKRKLVSTKELLNTPPCRSPIRDMYSQEQELNDISELEKIYGELPKTKLMVKKLDTIAPDRENNSCLSGWRGVYGSPVRPKGVYAMYEDIIDIMSNYSKDLCLKLVELIDKDLLEKVRFQDFGSLLVYNRTKSNLGIDNFNPNFDVIDDIMCVDQLMYFYADKICDETEDNKITTSQYGCVVLGMLDVFGDFKYDLKPDNGKNIPYPIRDKIKKNKFLFTNLSSNINVV